MRLAISNIAWDVAEDEAVAKLLARYGVDAIDIAPGKYFPELDQVKAEEAAKVKAWWADRGVEITGMQSLLFGTKGLNVFGVESVRSSMLSHLGHICRVAGLLGSPRLVFGSPRNRDRSDLSDSDANELAVSFFRRLGDIAQSHGVQICLEPNPVCYGANFMTTSAETAAVVRAVDHPAIKMQLDTGALVINKEKVENVLAKDACLIGHVHASEPDLVPLGDRGTDHRSIHEALRRSLPNHLVSIEMVATKDEPHLASIERALIVAVASYRSGEAAS